MAGIARVGDIVGKGGILIGPFSPDVTVNGRPVALTGCAYTPHGACFSTPPIIPHCFGVVGSIPSGVTVNGIPPLTKGSIAFCLDPILTASSDVILVESGLAQVASLAATVSGGGGLEGMSAYEKIGLQAAGSLVSGEDPNKVITSAVISAVGVQVGGAVSNQLVSEGISKAAAQATAQVVVAGGRAAVTGQDIGTALVTSAVTAGVGAGVNAAQGEIKKVIK